MLLGRMPGRPRWRQLALLAVLVLTGGSLWLLRRMRRWHGRALLAVLDAFARPRTTRAKPRRSGR